MNTRLILLIFFSIVMAYMTIMLSGFAQIISFLLFVVGTVAIIEVLKHFKWIQLNSSTLLIKQTFGRSSLLELNQIASWKEYSYPIRGQFKKSLVIFTTDERRIVISIYDDIHEYEKLSSYLKQNFADRAFA